MGRLSALPSRLDRPAGRLRALPKKADAFYHSDAWRKLRAAKKAQGPAFCCVCGVGDGARRDGKRVRLILDHREERRDGGADLPSLDALDWYCTGDHNRKTAAAKAARARGETAGGGRKFTR